MADLEPQLGWEQPADQSQPEVYALHDPQEVGAIATAALYEAPFEPQLPPEADQETMAEPEFIPNHRQLLPQEELLGFIEKAGSVHVQTIIYNLCGTGYLKKSDFRKLMNQVHTLIDEGVLISAAPSTFQLVPESRRQAKPNSQAGNTRPRKDKELEKMLKEVRGGVGFGSAKPKQRSRKRNKRTGRY